MHLGISRRRVSLSQLVLQWRWAVLGPFWSDLVVGRLSSVGGLVSFWPFFNGYDSDSDSDFVVCLCGF